MDTLQVLGSVGRKRDIFVFRRMQSLQYMNIGRHMRVHVCLIYIYMRRIKTFRSTADRIYDGSLIRYIILYYIILYRVFQKDGLNFVSLYFEIRTSDKYDVNYIWLYSTRARQLVARCTAVADSVLMNSRTQKILCCIVAILLSTDAAAWLCARRAL